MSVMALDIGDKRIGVAVGESTIGLALPLTTISRTSQAQDIEAVLSIVTEKHITTIVIGIPFSLSGQIGSQAKKVTYFAKLLGNHTLVPIKTVDERYSTVQAKKLITESGGKTTRDKSRIDAAAATVFLQSYMDTHSYE